MKTRILGTLLAVCLALSAVALAGDTATGLPTGTIVDYQTTVYDGTWAGANVVGTLYQGTGVIILQSYGTWMQIHARAERIVGWVTSSSVRYDQRITVYPGVVISQNVSLRESPSLGATRITSIPNGTVLDLLDEQSGWYYVAYYNAANTAPLEGWVLVDFIVRDPSFITTTASTYVYAMPSRDAKKVGQLVSGTQLVIIGEYGDFWVVNLRSASGFIYKRDVDDNLISGGNG
ncbi:SH3 domain-containing protein [Eubacteriales bacterium OttesenSCG-928-A19]|nr:SH3 domain-containing protein [Eubacteriales bacterium OttesenSCG-928-A19]